MAEKAAPKEQPLGPEVLMPWERQGANQPTSEHQASKDLFDLLAEDPSLGGEAGTGEPDEEDPEPEDDAGDEVPSDDDDESEDVPEDEEELEDSDEEEPDEPQLHEVKVRGQAKRVTLDELKAGYSRTEDYTQKAQKLASERKEFEAVRDETTRVREQYGQRLQRLEQALSASDEANVDWDKLRDTNPQEFVIRWAEHQRRQEQLNAVRTERQRVADEQMKEYQRQYTEFVNRERELLVEAIPNWKTEQPKLQQYAQSYGFSDEEMTNLVDHRIVVILRKAMLYDRATQKGKKVVDSAKKRGAPVLKPGVPRAPKVVRGQKAQRERVARLQESGRLDDAAAAIFHML